VFVGRVLGNVVAVSVEFQVVRASQVCGELLVCVGFGGAQFVIEVDDRRDDTKFVAQFEQQTKECNGIDPAGNGHADTISSAQ
jgi:hypothetical protein